MSWAGGAFAPRPDLALRLGSAALMGAPEPGISSQTVAGDGHALAQLLGSSVRTLQRELQERGTSHQALVEEIRSQRALQLLEEPEINVTEASYRLGFSEPSAFFRAFRRWTGTTPAAALASRRAHA